jgi:DNA polymerase-3 subunit beta
MQVKSKELLAAVSVAIKAVKKKNSLPILSNVLIRPRRESVEIVGSDMETTVIATVATDSPIIDPILLPAPLLSDILNRNTIKDDNTNIQIVVTDNVAVITTFFSTYRVPLAFNPSDYPDVGNKEKNSCAVTIDPRMLIGLAKNMKSGQSPALANIHFKPNGTIFATDGHRAIAIQTDCNFTGAMPFESAPIIGNLMKTPHLSYAFDHFQYTEDTMRVQVRGVEGVDAPNPDHLWNKGIDVEVDRVEFIAAIGRMAVMSDSVSLTVSEEGTAVLKAQDAERGEAQEAFTVPPDKPVVTIFNPHYMIGILSLMVSDYVTLQIGTAIVVQEDNFRAAIMPMKVN